MPLYANAEYLIRANLNEFAAGRRAKVIAIGSLTNDQFKTLNALRAAEDLPLLENPEIVFLGQHIYNSRVVRDEYTIDDVVLQICSALATTSIINVASRMTQLNATILRKDGYGKSVRDRAILELTSRKPRAELFSIIPKGDISPAELRKHEAKK